MGRPRIANPKIKHIGIVTTEEKYRRFKALGLVGDEAIDVLLYHLEKGNMELNIKKSQSIRRIKSLRKEIEKLEYEILKEETILEQINSEIGISDSGLGNDVEKSVKIVLQRFGKQKVYNLDEYLEENEKFVMDQAYLCNMENKLEKFKELVKANADSFHKMETIL